MGTKYTTQSTSGYNASPPPDDGTQVAANLITWAGVKTKLADVLKTFGEAINTALVSTLDLSARAISTPDTAVATDHWRTLQVTGTTTITLSSAASMGSGYEVGVFNAGVGVVTVTPGGASDTINGLSASVTVSIKGTKIFRTNQALTGYNVVGGSDPQTLTTTTSVVTPVIDSGSTGSLSLKTNNGTEQVRINHTATTVNRIDLSGNIATGRPSVLARGTDTNVTLLIATQGTGGVDFLTDIAATAPTQFQVTHTASSTRNITITGSNGGNPTIGVTAGSLAITPAVVLASTLTGPSNMLSPITNSLGGNVNLNNTANYFDGPSVAQGTSGTWFVSGSVTVTDASAAAYSAKLWDGTTVISSGQVEAAGAERQVISLSGFITTPAGNLRISVKDATTTAGLIVFNASGNSKDSTITAIRIA